MIKLSIRPFLLLITYCLLLGALPLFAAQEDNKLVTLSKQIIEAKTNESLYPLFEELKDLYFKENCTDELINYGKFHFSLNSGDYLKPTV